MSERKPNIMIDGSKWWIDVNEYEKGTITIDLLSHETGEIRQKKVSYDVLARRVFASEIRTWKKQNQKIEMVPFQEATHE